MNRALLLLALSLVLVACSSTPTVDPGARLDAESGDLHLTAPLPDLVSYRFVDPDSGRVLQIEDVMLRMADKDVVMAGEYHGHPAIHLAQLAVLRAMHESERSVALSMEQFERDVQDTLDQYLAGELGEAPLKKDARAWPSYGHDYRPLVEYCRVNGLPVIAANAPRRYVRMVGKQGPESLDELPTDEREWVAAELHLDDDKYMARFFRVMSGHAGAAPEDPAERRKRFAPQAVWDDTMAESIVKYLQTHPGHLVVHTCGAFHSAGGLGTVTRIKLRMPDARVGVIHPIQVEDAADPVIPADKLGEGDILVVVSPLPPRYVDPEREKAAMQELMKRMKARRSQPEK